MRPREYDEWLDERMKAIIIAWGLDQITTLEAIERRRHVWATGTYWRN